ncbi:uncharacterized protein LOC126839293 [Adelges cooleyi]|uniref:uncharacterized protein LOC126839293 n=1 Tax=Adelges cooleyi TaxID=133065 RepID=UPI0021803924|nr:uncharacterized protein LOC126839293 [Adelges cooleyi]
MYLCVQQGKKQTCSGDSGGPTICNGKQYAVCMGSYSASGNPKFKCGDSDVVTMHLFLYFFRDWISGVVGPLESGGGDGREKEEEGNEDDDNGEQEYGEEYADAASTGNDHETQAEEGGIRGDDATCGS